METKGDIDRDIAMLREMIDGPDAGSAAFLAERPYPRTMRDARADLASLIEELEDARAGRVVPHARIIEDAEERRRRHRIQAAE